VYQFGTNKGKNRHYFRSKTDDNNSNLVSHRYKIYSFNSICGSMFAVKIIRV